MKKENEKLHFLKCGHCEGSGVYNGTKCKVCQGRGLACYLDGHILYWGEKIDYGSLRFNMVERTVAKIIFVILFLMVFLGVFSLLYAIGSAGILNILQMSFWSGKNIYLLYFWISVLADLYLIYYSAQNREAKELVVKRTYSPIVNSGEYAPNLDWQTIRSTDSEDLIDISRSFDEEALTTVENAFEIADKYMAPEVLPVHFLLAALITSKEIEKIFTRSGCDFNKLLQTLGLVASNYIQSEDESIFSSESIKVMMRAYQIAYLNRGQEVKASDILLAAIKSDDEILEAMVNLGAQSVVDELIDKKKYTKFFRTKAGLIKAMQELQTPILTNYSSDLTVLVHKGKILNSFNEDELNDIYLALKQHKNFVFIQENEDAEKIARSIAHEIAQNFVPLFLENKRVVSLDIERLLNSASLSQARERLYLCLNEIIRSGNVILFIDNIHDLMPELNEILAEALSRSSFIFFTGASAPEYERAIKNTSLQPLLKVIEI